MNNTTTAATEPQNTLAELRALLLELDSEHTSLLIQVQDMLDLMHFLDTFFIDEVFEPNSKDKDIQLSDLDRIAQYSHYRGLNYIVHDAGRNIETKVCTIGHTMVKVFELVKHCA